MLFQLTSIEGAGIGRCECTVKRPASGRSFLSCRAGTRAPQSGRSIMYALPARNRKILARKIRHHKRLCFPGKGSGVRLADEIGVSPQTISNWLNGSRTPTFEQLYLLAKTFNVSPLELCGIKEIEKTPRNAADISLLRSLLDIFEHAMEHDDSIRSSVKAMKSINNIVFNEMEEY